MGGRLHGRSGSEPSRGGPRASLGVARRGHRHGSRGRGRRRSAGRRVRERGRRPVRRGRASGRGGRTRRGYVNRGQRGDRRRTARLRHADGVPLRESAGPQLPRVVDLRSGPLLRLPRLRRLDLPIFPGDLGLAVLQPEFPIAEPPSPSRQPPASGRPTRRATLRSSRPGSTRGPATGERKAGSRLPTPGALAPSGSGAPADSTGHPTPGRAASRGRSPYQPPATRVPRRGAATEQRPRPLPNGTDEPTSQVVPAPGFRCRGEPDAKCRDAACRTGEHQPVGNQRPLPDRPQRLDPVIPTSRGAPRGTAGNGDPDFPAAGSEADRHESNRDIRTARKRPQCSYPSVPTTS